MNVLPIKIAVSVLAFLLLSSCLSWDSKNPYPDNWASPEQSQGGSCPNISGVYFDKGEYEATASGRPCGRVGSRDCESLTYALTYGANIFTSRRVWPTRVQIEQPAPDVVEIHDIAKSDEKKQMLLLSNGDFTCDSDGLRLSDKTTVAVLLFTNLIKNETRTFNRASDGSLIMNSKWRTTGHHTIMPVSMKEEGWVRWKRSDLIKTTVKPPPLNSTVKPQPLNPDYLSCIKRGVEKCDEYVSCFSGGKRQWTNRSKCD